jgi:serine/threonine-protein phosphatase PGAM5
MLLSLLVRRQQYRYLSVIATAAVSSTATAAVLLVGGTGDQKEDDDYCYTNSNAGVGTCIDTSIGTTASDATTTASSRSPNNPTHGTCINTLLRLYSNFQPPPLTPSAVHHLIQRTWDHRGGAAVTLCEAPQQSPRPLETNADNDKKGQTDTIQINQQPQEQQEQKQQEEVLYNGLFPLRQLWTPKVPYPQWDKDWDGKHPPQTNIATTNTGEKDHSHHERLIRKHGITRHIILIRHGQYDERHPDDHKRVLTPLGRKQAELTGRRLAEMIRGINEQFGPCHVKILRVSDMARAKETAEIIAGELPDWVERAEPDPLLNEGRPCHTIPGGRVSQKVIEKTDQGHERIEEAFRKYFYRADVPLCRDEENREGVDQEKGATESEGEKQTLEHSPTKDLEFHPQHEFEIIVCHANVIRYFLCRALQLPPEAWLRMCTFNCSLNYVTIRPTGSVSVRMLGDIGHLGYEHATFSMHHGFNW